MKNKKLTGLGISIVIAMCAAVGCGNSEAVETVATMEAEEPETIEKIEESETMEKVEEATKPSEEAPAVEESVEKVEEEQAKETEKEVETSAKEDAIKEAETDYTKEAEELWGVHSEEFECNYETFRENYTEEREGGSDKETAYETVHNILKKVEENVIVKDYEIIPLDEATMYATQACNVRSGPSTKYERIGGLAYSEEVTVVGKAEYDGSTWYVLKSDDAEETKMVSAKLLTDTKPQPQQSAANNNESSYTKIINGQEVIFDTAPVDSSNALAGLPGAGPGIDWDSIQWISNDPVYIDYDALGIEPSQPGDYE